MAKRAYSLVEIAEGLGRARSTVVEWSRLFRDYLPTVGTGRAMRYTEEAREVFGLIAKMKEANEPNEYIRDQLREIVREIIIPISTKEENTPYLMQLSGEVDALKRAVALLAERIAANEASTRQEIATAAETLREELGAVSERIHSLQDGQQLILSRMETLGKRRRWWLW